jgi:hypothetical protein
LCDAGQGGRLENGAAIERRTYFGHLYFLPAVFLLSARGFLSRCQRFYLSLSGILDAKPQGKQRKARPTFD